MQNENPSRARCRAKRILLCTLHYDLCTLIGTSGLPCHPSFWYKRAAQTAAPLGTTAVYKFLLCSKYLRTRYLAFVCIVSVMLGVSTLIVVNSVMSGFSHKLQNRLHGILSDVIVETDRADGLPDAPDVVVARILASPIGQYVEATSPTVEVAALLQFQVCNSRTGERIPITKHVRMIGVDPARHAKVGKFLEYLQRQKGGDTASFALTAEGNERLNFNTNFGNWFPTAPARQLDPSPIAIPEAPHANAPPGLFLPELPVPERPRTPPPVVAAAGPPRMPGLFIGHAIAYHTWKDPDTGVSKTTCLLSEGDEVFLATVGATGTKPVSSSFVVADYFKCEMSEYDNNFVYVGLEDLQSMRGMGNRVNTVQIKLIPSAAADQVLVHKTIIPELQKMFGREVGTSVVSWQQHQGAILEAIDIERGILNLLLFMIVGVSGFSILAIFTMIVSEKYRDIGVLKSLGASSRGVMSIFVTYGLMLGVVGCGLGTLLGLGITTYINEIEGFLTLITKQQIFDRGVYYFDKIPTNIESTTVILVNIGAIGTSVLFSVLPAFRAARLHPVNALRFE